MMMNRYLQNFTDSDNLSAWQFSEVSLLSLLVARPAKLCLEMSFTNKVCCYVKSQQVSLGSTKTDASIRNLYPQAIYFTSCDGKSQFFPEPLTMCLPIHLSPDSFVVHHQSAWVVTTDSFACTRLCLSSTICFSPSVSPFKCLP